MRSYVEEHKGSGEAFITQGFINRKKKESDGFQIHIRGLYSFQSKHGETVKL